MLVIVYVQYLLLLKTAGTRCAEQALLPGCTHSKLHVGEVLPKKWKKEHGLSTIKKALIEILLWRPLETIEDNKWYPASDLRKFLK